MGRGLDQTGGETILQVVEAAAQGIVARPAGEARWDAVANKSANSASCCRWFRNLAASSDRIAIVFVAWILYRASGFRIVKISPIIGARVSNTASDSGIVVGAMRKRISHEIP